MGGGVRCFLLPIVQREGDFKIDASDSKKSEEDIAPPSPATLAKYFHQFEILELVGQGGMGAVYKAKHSGLDRLVAIKIIVPRAASHPGFAERFAREAKALAKLSHPNIVAVYDFGLARPLDSDSGTLPPLYFLVMEYVDGFNLRQSMARQTLAPHQTLLIIAQICEALHYAHQVGVIHRDIKPENLLISTSHDSSGTSCLCVKIVDFGLAKLIENEASSNLTGTHQVVGTVRYMAPEQMDGSTVDHRVGIYALGVVFYEMLTGHLPVGSFERPSKCADIDTRIDEVVMRSLAPEPARRYQHAIEIKTAVDGIQRHPSSSGLSVARHPKLIEWVMLSGGLASTGFAALLYWFTESFWASLGLTVPSAFLAFWVSRFRDKMSGPWIAASVTACVLSASALIAVIAVQADSSSFEKFISCALLMALMAIVATLSALGGNELRRLARLTRTEKEEWTRKAKEMETRNGIDTVAFFLGATGFFRTLSLFSIVPLSEKSQSSTTPWLAFTGPLLIVASISMHHTRFFVFCAIGCVLSFVTGNPFAILVGIAGLLTLFKSDVRSLFQNEQRITDSTQRADATQRNATTQTMNATLAYLPADSKTIRHRWGFLSRASDNWIRGWGKSVLQIVRSSLLLTHLACLILAFSFQVESKFSGDERETVFNLGSPKPWFSIESFQKPIEGDNNEGSSKTPSRGIRSGVHWRFHLSAGILWVVLIAIVSAFVIWRIDLITKPDAVSRYRPTSILKLWLFVLCVLVFFGMILVVLQNRTIALSVDARRVPGTCMTNAWLVEQGVLSLKTLWAELAHLR